jgi:hypothetical protein
LLWEPVNNNASSETATMTLECCHDWGSRKIRLVRGLINETGGIAHDVAVGTDAILELMARTARLLDETPELPQLIGDHALQ